MIVLFCIWVISVLFSFIFVVFMRLDDEDDKKKGKPDSCLHTGDQYCGILVLGVSGAGFFILPVFAMVILGERGVYSKIGLQIADVLAKPFLQKKAKKISTEDLSVEELEELLHRRKNV